MRKQQLKSVIAVLIAAALTLILIFSLNKCSKDENSAPSVNDPVSSVSSDDEMPSVDADTEDNSSREQEWTSLYDTSVID